MNQSARDAHDQPAKLLVLGGCESEWIIPMAA
jgi:hypothetical protein